jgi:hypothetical protein
MTPQITLSEGENARTFPPLSYALCCLPNALAFSPSVLSPHHLFSDIISRSWEGGRHKTLSFLPPLPDTLPLVGSVVPNDDLWTGWMFGSPNPLVFPLSHPVLSYSFSRSQSLDRRDGSPTPGPLEAPALTKPLPRGGCS